MSSHKPEYYQYVMRTSAGLSAVTDQVLGDMIRDMSYGCPVRVRSLGSGESIDAQEAGWEGKTLSLMLGDGKPVFTPGDLVEIQSESRLYLGEVRRCEGTALKVSVEHALDRARLISMQDTWR